MTHKERNGRDRVSGIFGLVCAYGAAFTLGYGLTAVIYRFTGEPPEILRHFFSALTAIILILAGWRIILQFGGRDSHMKDVLTVHEKLTEAISQIAQGNFNVLIDQNEAGVFNDLAAAINDMAKNLGSLETMRQDFISNVSHEIQSPLTSIGGFAALLQKDGLSDADRRKYASIIGSESSRLSSLSENLLKLSALDDTKIQLNKREYRLDRQLETIALALEPQWTAKNLTVEADLQKLSVCGDEDLLSQVWINLLHNAIKFTPDGGRISISLAAVDNAAAVTISDTGVGIGPEDQVHIFERFYKVDRARDRSLGGNGLGLSLVKKIIELHAGYIFVESGPGSGTAFQVILKD